MSRVLKKYLVDVASMMSKTWNNSIKFKKFSAFKKEMNYEFNRKKDNKTYSGLQRNCSTNEKILS